MSEVMTPQFDILTQMKVAQKEDGSIIINPFFNSSYNKVVNNFSYAKEVYKDVFRRFIYVWYIRQSKFIPPCNWEILEI